MNKILTVIIKDVDVSVAGRDIAAYSVDVINESFFLNDYIEAEAGYTMEDALKDCRERGYDVCVMLPAGYPIRYSLDLDAMMEALLTGEYQKIVGVVKIADKNTSIWTGKGSEYIKRGEGITAYAQCDSVTMFKAGASVEKVTAYPLDREYAISYIEDEYRCTQILRLRKALKEGAEPMEFVFDIDGVVAVAKANLQYDEEEPIMEVIEIINRLYDNGHTIIMNTARGYKTGIDWCEATKEQFARWGLKYSELKFGKPSADIYVDDKMLSVADLKAFSGG